MRIWVHVVHAFSDRQSHTLTHVVVVAHQHASSLHSGLHVLESPVDVASEVSHFELHIVQPSVNLLVVQHCLFLLIYFFHSRRSGDLVLVSIVSDVFHLEVLQSSFFGSWEDMLLSSSLSRREFSLSILSAFSIGSSSENSIRSTVSLISLASFFTKEWRSTSEACRLRFLPNGASSALFDFLICSTSLGSPC